MNTNPHPEWKRIKAEIQPLLEAGKTQYTYGELSALAGVDIRTQAGRKQFHRFRDEALKEWSIWFEVETNQGYRAVPAHEHMVSAAKQHKKARRRMACAKRILDNTRFDKLTEDQLKTHLTAAAMTGALLSQMRSEGRKQVKLAAAMTAPMLAAPDHPSKVDSILRGI